MPRPILCARSLPVAVPCSNAASLTGFLHVCILMPSRIVRHGKAVNSGVSCFFLSLQRCCGSAGEFLGPAQAAGCQCLVTGEVRFHTALEAESLGMSLVLAGHFASERFAVEQLADVLAAEFPSIKTWASQQEKDPIQWR